MFHRKPELEPDQFSIYATQVQTYAGFAGTMAVVVMFFTGLILTKFESFDLSIKVPVAFLIVSIFKETHRLMSAITIIFGLLLFASQLQNF